MKISTLNLTRLHNEAHFQFMFDFKSLIENNNSQALGIDDIFKNFLVYLNNEKEALSKIHGNSKTDDLVEADLIRDTTFRGLIHAVKSAKIHFRPEVQQAANHLEVVFNKYGNVTSKPYDEETTAINNLVAELQENSSSDANLIGISEWVTELKSNNDAFLTIKTDRYSQEASKTQLKVKEERQKIDELYNTIVEKINALIIVNGEARYSNFVNELNIRINSVTTVMAQHKKVNTKQETVK